MFLETLTAASFGGKIAMSGDSRTPHCATAFVLTRLWSEWLATSKVPKLFVKAEPGLLIASGANLNFARGLPAQTEVTVAGLHYLQEDSPDEIGRAIADWIRVLG